MSNCIVETTESLIIDHVEKPKENQRPVSEVREQNGRCRREKAGGYEIFAD